MNANAYGGDLSRVLEWVERRHAGRQRAARAGAARLLLPALEPRPARGRRARVVRCSRADEPERVKATLADMRAQRRAAQPSGIKTFGSTFKNPDDPRAEGRSAGVLLDEAGCRGLTVGGARFSEKHANFVENMGEATTADVIALMAEGRRRVRERFGVTLEPEVQLLGDDRRERAVRQLTRPRRMSPPPASAPPRHRHDALPGLDAWSACACPRCRPRRASRPLAAGDRCVLSLVLLARLPVLVSRLLVRARRAGHGQRAPRARTPRACARRSTSVAPLDDDARRRPRGARARRSPATRSCAASRSAPTSRTRCASA